MSSISLLQAQEMIARCERNRKKSSPDPYGCSDAYEVAEQREVGRSGIHEGIEKWLRSLGNRCFYIHSRTDRKTTCEIGNADFIGWLWTDRPRPSGIPFCIEIKQRNKKPTPAQLARLKQAECAGAITGVAHSLSEFKAILGMP